MASTTGFKARVEYEVTDGTQTTYTFPFSYLRKKFVMVSILHSDGTETALEYGIDYTINDLSVSLTTPAQVGEHLIIYRQTTTDKIITWNDGSILLARDMNTEDAQMLHLQEEQQDYITSRAISTKVTSDKEVLWDALNHRISNVSDPKDPQDAVTKHYMENVQGGFVSANTILVQEATKQANAAKASQESAKASATQASDSERASLASANLAEAWATSTTSPDNIVDAESATGKTQSSRSWALFSKSKAQEAVTSATAVHESATKAKASETKALASEQNAKASETKVATSEHNAKVSEQNAKTSEINAKDSETNASSSAESASSSETNALASEINARNSAQAASTSETNAKYSEQAAATSATNAQDSKNNAGSYAGSAYSSSVRAHAWADATGSPDGEDDSFSTTGKTRSAKGWAEQAKTYAEVVPLQKINVSFDSTYVEDVSVYKAGHVVFGYCGFKKSETTPHIPIITNMPKSISSWDCTVTPFSAVSTDGVFLRVHMDANSTVLNLHYSKAWEHSQGNEATLTFVYMTPD